LSRLTLRRSLAAGVAAAAVLAPVAATASLAGPTGVSFGGYGAPFVHPNGSAYSTWGGYISQGGGFKTVKASWVVAKVDCSQSALFAPWVGIDGDGSDTVEQTGVQTECSGGQASYSAWYEMYPAGPVYYSNPVSLGDKFTASVTANGTNFTLTIKDDTKGWTQTTHASLSSAQLFSAEAVIEAPGGYPSFAKQKFSNVYFNGKTLKANNPQASITSTGGPVYKPTKINKQTNFNMVMQK
jgi:hypothetical protein